jgi:hypothetical protein
LAGIQTPTNDGMPMMRPNRLRIMPRTAARASRNAAVRSIAST